MVAQSHSLSLNDRRQREKVRRRSLLLGPPPRSLFFRARSFDAPLPFPLPDNAFFCRRLQPPTRARGRLHRSGFLRRPDDGGGRGARRRHRAHAPGRPCSHTSTQRRGCSEEPHFIACHSVLHSLWQSMAGRIAAISLSFTDKNLLNVSQISSGNCNS